MSTKKDVLAYLDNMLELMKGNGRQITHMLYVEKTNHNSTAVERYKIRHKRKFSLVKK